MIRLLWLAAAREAGVSDGEIAEVVGHVALNVLTNYFNVLGRGWATLAPIELTRRIRGTQRPWVTMRRK